MNRICIRPLPTGTAVWEEAASVERNADRYPDTAIVDDVIRGFALTGWSPKTGVFQPDVRRPNLSVQQLICMSPGLNAAVIESQQRDFQCLRKIKSD